MNLLTAVILITLTASLQPAWCQDDSQLTPRQLFLIKAPSPAPAPGKPAPAPSKPEPKSTASKPVAANPPLVLKYTILQKKGDSFQQVDADTQFHSGDRIRLKVEANASAYLYIVLGGSSGQWRVLFPSAEIAGGKNRIEAGQSCTIPPENDPPFYFDETAGVEKVSLVLSRAPEADLEKLIYSVAAPARTIPDPVMGHVRDQLASRDLVFEKYDGTASDGKQEKAVYAATKDTSPDARLFVDLKLVHK